ncbi:MAG: radical SAM protein [Candidatus Omnitrophica bacterium]|nr:radical SAM protein [Candidatus Omnitrophota bacterium]
MRVALIRSRDKVNINTRLPESLNMVRGELPPLGLAYIASVLENAGHQVRIFDISAANLTQDEFRKQLFEFSPALAGITVMTPTLFGALESARIAKEVGAVTVLGGPQLSIYPEETVAYAQVDYGIHGEGEYAMLALVDVLEKRVQPDTVGGLIYKYNGKVFINAPAIVQDLDTLPFPAYHLLPMTKYNSIIGDYPTSTMISSRGCPYQCHFCFKQPSDEKIRLRSAKKVVEEMKYLVENFKVKEIMFYDDVLTFSRQHVFEICQEILSSGLKIKWESPARVDNADKELLELMYKAGCVRLRYGVESADERILELMNKRINLSQVETTFKLTKKIGMETFAYFMVGYAHETIDTIKKTISFARKLNPDWAMFTIATPYPGTPLYKLALQEGVLKNDYWREFTLGTQKDKRIPYFIADAPFWVKKAYLRFYFRLGFIIKRASRIRCLQDWQKCWQGIQGILSMGKD